ncbi:universal stress protein [Castellaniella sp. MT123]|uniref:universal stress protein n=1 Tax=Castellaniella sp. MT123 TaxID=3140381 RepID=UPI0031F3923C
MYRQILVAVDGSEVANQAFEHAIGLAQQVGAKLLVIYIVEYPRTVYASEAFDVGPFYQAMLDEAKTVLDKAKARLSQAGVQGEVKMIDSGNIGNSVADELEDAVKTLGADLVVMGTHGRRGFQRLMLGSVAEAFVRRSPVPVMLIPAGSH